jgi:cyclohexadienyl dehydratase
MKTFITLLCCLTLFAAQPVRADRLGDIQARGTLRVGTTGDYAPFSFKTAPGGPLQGLDIDMARDLAAALGVKLELVPTSWSTLSSDMTADRFDIAMGGVSISLERQKLGLFTIPYLQDGKTPITLCSNVAHFQTLADINRPDVRLITNPGGSNEHFARTHAPSARLQVYPDNNTIFTQLIAGKADLMITDAVETRYQQTRHPELCAVHPDRPFNFAEKAYWLPNDWRWKAWLDQWLSLRLQDGSFAAISRHWLGR